MKYVIIFTKYTGYEKYAVLVKATSKKQAISKAKERIDLENRQYDTIECVLII